MRHLLLLAIGSAVIVSGITVYSLIYFNQDHPLSLLSSSDAPIPYDLVTITVHDKFGDLKYQTTTHNIVTGAGAIWFCVQQDRCQSQITNPATTFVSNPTWWIQFINGTINVGEPTGADCTSPSGGGAITGQVSGGRCVTTFGLLAGHQYSTGTVATVSLTNNGGKLTTGSGNIDTTNNFVQTTAGTVCTTVTDTPTLSSTCQFSDTTPTMTYQGALPLTISGIALASGTNSNSTAGPLIIAEATITPVILNLGDTISVTWTVTT
jgi:hypothetical protein